MHKTNCRYGKEHPMLQQNKFYHSQGSRSGCFFMLYGAQGQGPQRWVSLIWVLIARGISGWLNNAKYLSAGFFFSSKTWYYIENDKCTGMYTFATFGKLSVFKAWLQNKACHIVCLVLLMSVFRAMGFVLHWCICFLWLIDYFQFDGEAVYQVDYNVGSDHWYSSFL